MLSPFVGKELFNMILAIRMLLKIGAPPFHFWFPEIIEKIRWSTCLILITWQKLAPIYILSCTVDIRRLFISMAIPVMVLVGSIGGLNQTSIRKIISYSSIDHIGWIIACIKFNNRIWIFYFFIYTIILISIIYVFQFHSAYYINQYSNKRLNFIEKIIIIVSFIRLGGLPPFLGFLPKLIVIQLIIINQSYIISIILVSSTLITLFYYLRLIGSILLINNSTTKWNFTININNISVTTIISINILFPIISIFWI